MQPPAQEIVARDLHDTVWTFRHIYRGMFSLQIILNFRVVSLHGTLFLLRIMTSVVPLLNITFNLWFLTQDNQNDTCLLLDGAYLLVERDFSLATLSYSSGDDL